MIEPDYTARSDSLETKLALFRQALADGHYDLALALTDSLKDGVEAERQFRADPGEPLLAAASVGEVAALPAPWAAWARGWSDYQVLSVRETAGLARHNEPLDLLVSVPSARTTSLRREARLARIAPETGALQEVPCQVYDERCRGAERLGRLVFMASLPAQGQATFLLFSNNPEAELPAYTTDLQVRGEGFGLDIENDYYIASLSRQMGQLERLTYKYAHGLELFAGGEGHGEPPNIDWAHDYLAADFFQKFRVTNWATCPNCEVVRGPLCVSVRRWGFPHSPVHPLFTPSRMFIDVTYTFYAHTPYFLKRGRMEMVKDFSLNYLRDDEWVFSGYSFDEALWMGPDGRLQEGLPPAEQQDDLWGVGFYHRDGRHAFIALHLEHEAEGFPGVLYHAGPPVLDYQGHGQLWSRWAARDNPFFPAGAVLKQRNAYLTLSYPRENGPAAAENYWQTLRQPLQAAPVRLAGLTASASEGQLARPGEAGDSPISKRAIWAALRECVDDMLYRIDSNVVDLGYIRDVRVQGHTVYILMTMPHHGRPKFRYLGNPMRQRLLKLPQVEHVVIDVTWDPPWSANDLSDAGWNNLQLGARPGLKPTAP